MARRSSGFLRRWFTKKRYSPSTDTVISDPSACLVLVGLTFVLSGDVVATYQTHGIVVSTKGNLLRIRRSDGSLFHLPFDSGTIVKASPGEYRKRNTGIVIEDPDYIIQRELHIGSMADIDTITANGYLP